MNKQNTFIILGAGPTGLGTALGLCLNGQTDNVIVIEKAHQVGGLAGSFVWKNHIIDYGPHRLSSSLPDIKTICDEILGSELLTLKSQHGVQLQGVLCQFPPRVIDWISPPQIARLIAYTMSYIKARLDWTIRRFDQEKTFKQIVSSKFGNRFYSFIIQPMCKKVWIDPVYIDPEFAEIRFEHINPTRALKKLISPLKDLNPTIFYYPKKGFIQIWDYFSKYVKNSGGEILLDSEPIEIELDGNKITKVKIRNSKSTKVFEGTDLQLISTIPLINFVKTIKSNESWVSNLVEDLSQIKIRSMLLVCIEFNQPKTLPFRTLIFPEAKFIFNRIFEQNLYSPDTVEKGKSVIVADITTGPKDPILSLSDEEIFEKTMEGLRQLKYINTDCINDFYVRRVPFAYIVPDTNSREIMFNTVKKLSEIQNLHLRGRFSIGEYDNSDYAIEHGLKLSEFLVKKTSKLEYLRQLSSISNRHIVG